MSKFYWWHGMAVYMGMQEEFAEWMRLTEKTHKKVMLAGKAAFIIGYDQHVDELTKAELAQ